MFFGVSIAPPLLTDELVPSLQNAENPAWARKNYVDIFVKTCHCFAFRVVKHIGVKEGVISDSQLRSVYPVLINALADYTIDARGDIGSM